jgi:hypothetical protein
MIPLTQKGRTMRSVPKTRIIADIMIQQDILAFLNSGGRIITSRARKSKNKPVKALSTLSTKSISL